MISNATKAKCQAPPKRATFCLPARRHLHVSTSQQSKPRFAVHLEASLASLRSHAADHRCMAGSKIPTQSSSPCQTQPLSTMTSPWFSLFPTDSDGRSSGLDRWLPSFVRIRRFHMNFGTKMTRFLQANSKNAAANWRNFACCDDYNDKHSGCCVKPSFASAILAQPYRLSRTGFRSRLPQTVFSPDGV